ncbi:hypothetical protein [Limnoglobus roseus]|uniref:Uncharacterized protein n=1 Tax=Limnoglobus roseus TaxID=2598579 RepID=A0A5C1AFG1_9BACT|nr:hypothetical protein [Limnoglobus roseus]QEL16706.1 hypothetical protein PX52LOC_03669 [Limnoglobus roseus]
MSQAKEAVAIIERATGAALKAMLHKELDESELIDVEIAWEPKRLRALKELRRSGADLTDLPQHFHWSWARKALQTSGMLAYRAFGIKFKRQMQGLMMVELASHVARLDPDKGKPLVYVDYVETAPWNAREFTSSPTYNREARKRLDREHLARSSAAGATYSGPHLRDQKPTNLSYSFAGSFDRPARYTSAGVLYPSDWCKRASL